MIGGLVLALLATAQPPAGPLVVRSAGATDTVAVETGVDGADRVAADALARALRGSLATPRPGRVRIAVGETALELVDGIPYVAVGGEVYPLADAPAIDAAGGRVLVPLQLATEVLPRAVTGWSFDVAARELRAFATVARQGAGTPAADPAPRRDPAPPVRTEAPASPTRARHTVVVDAGHGGPDGGMQGVATGGRRIREKDVTLAVAREVQQALRERGVEVVMTRTRDTLIALADRGRIANQRRGNLFISIHVNAANPAWRNAAASRGFETYFLAEAKTDDERRVADMENESVRFETGPSAGKGDPLSFIITDMAQNEHLRESSELAARVQRRLARAHPGPSRGVKQAGFKVLVTAFMPAVLVEIGFGSNVADAAYIASPAGQRELGASIAAAAEEYLTDYERRVARGAAGR